MSFDAQYTNYKHFTPLHFESAREVRPTTAKRQEWIDCLRGITMLLVVITHCETYLAAHHSAISNFCLAFRMPLFFYISGYFAYSSKLKIDSPKTIIQPIRRRIIGVLIPTIIFCGLFCLLLDWLGGMSLSEVIHDSQKGGYWFTIVSFTIFMLCLPLILVSNSPSLKSHTKTALILFVMAFSAWSRDYLVSHWINYEFVSISSLEYTLEYLPYFALGILTHINRPILHDKFDRWWIIVGIVAIYLIASVYAPNLKYRHMDFRFFPFISIFLIALFLIFYRLRGILHSANPVGRSLSYIGRNTLQIYLMHYFIVILFSMESVQLLHDWKSIDLDYMFPLTITVSILIICLCLGMDMLLRTLKIRHFFFPKYK